MKLYYNPQSRAAIAKWMLDETDFETVEDVIEGELGDGPFLFGDWFTAADVMIGCLFIWKRLWGGPPELPKLEAYVDRLLERPAAMKIGG